MNNLSPDQKYKVLCFNGNRDGYTPDQCYPTCTVGELIDQLRNYDENLLVFIDNDDGHTYGSIDIDTFEERVFNDDDDDDDDNDDE